MVEHPTPVEEAFSDRLPGPCVAPGPSVSRLSLLLAAPLLIGVCNAPQAAMAAVGLGVEPEGVVDPMLAQMAKLLPSTPPVQDGVQFGYTVAVSGDTALVGAYLDDHAAGSDAGSAYVFTRSGTVWTEQQKLAASDAAGGDYFGISVALDGDTALIGADHASGGSGAAYVFTRTGTDWTEQQKLTASDATTNDFFGRSVALSGDTALIGAPWDDIQVLPGLPYGEEGSAYVFTRSGTTWTEQQKLTARDSSSLELGVPRLASYLFFGNSVALSGDSALIGEPGFFPGRGSAYVFTRSGTTWTRQQGLVPSDTGGRFGSSVALSGDSALVGADYGSADGSNFTGTAYVFTRSGTVWTEQQRLTASDVTADDVFAASVALSGDAALIGAYWDDRHGGSNPRSVGSVYVFTRSGTVWAEEHKLTADDGAEGDRFGVSVAISADTAVFGAYWDDHDGGIDAGSAYVFMPPVADLSVTKSDSPEPLPPGELLTYTLVVDNGGPASATNLLVTDTLPPTTDFLAASGSGWSCSEAGGIVTCSRATLEAGATAPPITIQVVGPLTPGSITNTATVTGDELDLETANNTAMETTTVPAADLSLAIIDTPDPVVAEATLLYLLTVANDGPDEATSVVVTSTLPVDTTFLSAGGDGWGCGESGGIVTCTRPLLAVASAPAIAIAVVAPATGGVITEVASVTSPEVDPDPSDNSTFEHTAVVVPIFADGFESGDTSRWFSGPAPSPAGASETAKVSAVSDPSYDLSGRAGGSIVAPGRSRSGL